MISDLEVLTAIISSLLNYFNSSFGRHVEYRNCEFTYIPLDEGAEARYGFSENQILDLECSFVGIERFRIREETTDVIVGRDAVAAAQLEPTRLSRGTWQW